MSEDFDGFVEPKEQEAVTIWSNEDPGGDSYSFQRNPDGMWSLYRIEYINERFESDTFGPSLNLAKLVELRDALNDEIATHGGDRVVTAEKVTVLYYGGASGFELISAWLTPEGAEGRRRKLLKANVDYNKDGLHYETLKILGRPKPDAPSQ